MFLFWLAEMNAQITILNGQITVRSVDLVQNNDLLYVSISMDADRLHIKSNQDVVFLRSYKMQKDTLRSCLTS